MMNPIQGARLAKVFAEYDGAVNAWVEAVRHGTADEATAAFDRYLQAGAAMSNAIIGATAT